jgi:ferrous iron transport protein A
MSAGEKGYVVALRGGRDFQQRVADQELYVGAEITVIQKDGADAKKGPIVVSNGTSTIRIGRGMGSKIFVGSRVKVKDLQIGQCARVTGYVTSDRDYRHKLLRMGMVKQAEFKLVRVAPLGDPVVIEIKGSNLTLRKAEADAIEIEVITTP